MSKDWGKVKWHIQMRLKLAGQLGQQWPETVQLILNHHINRAKTRGLQMVHFKVTALPKSTNHMYKKNRDYRDEATGKMKISFRLDPKIEEYRLLVMEALGADRWSWKPTGVTAAIILLESPAWITQKRLVREMDADNKVKPILDAVQNATETPDELHWELHVFKIQSKWTRTSVYLFDLGDIVEFFS